uniref:Secreted protein n=1 Tax=Schistosoma mansoni TaxID=6183 RepID=A0A5K4F715_SCHMA
MGEWLRILCVQSIVFGYSLCYTTLISPIHSTNNRGDLLTMKQLIKNFYISLPNFKIKINKNLINKFTGKHLCLTSKVEVLFQSSKVKHVIYHTKFKFKIHMATISKNTNLKSPLICQRIL